VSEEEDLFSWPVVTPRMEATVLEVLGGLSISRFCEALRAEGVRDCQPGCNLALHTHPLFHNLDVYGSGKPTNMGGSSQTPKQPEKSLRVSAGIQPKVFKVPWFKRYRTKAIGQYAEAFHKVVENYHELLSEDPEDPESLGSWGTSSLFVSR